ncbi:MAG: serine/threonine-protein phosphatase [Clostridiales bacterium]|nr:serine/threonine-protein phosphatase [Candidatus Scatonaster coprocaballi]
MSQSNRDKIVYDSNSSMKIAILSCLGDREEQQDSFRYSLNKENGMVVICDGMGGHHGGAEASRVSAECFLNNYTNSQTNTVSADALIYSAQESDRLVVSLTDSDGTLLKAGSTCVAITIHGKELFWCSVGDSRAYLLRQNEFVQLTSDQNYSTVLKEKLKAGLITSEEYNQEIQNGEALISYLGIGNLSLIDFNLSPIELCENDIVVVMTDGYYRLLSDEDIQRVITNFRNCEEAVQVIETKAANIAKRKSISRDNATIAIISINY